MLTIKLEESECFSSWVMSNSTRLESCTGDVIKCELRLRLIVLHMHFPTCTCRNLRIVCVCVCVCVIVHVDVVVVMVWRYVYRGYLEGNGGHW